MSRPASGHAAAERRGVLDTIVSGVMEAMQGTNQTEVSGMDAENDYITTTVNGRMVRVRRGATATDLRKAAGIPEEEKISETSQRSAKLVDDKEPVKSGSVYRSIVPTVQG